MRNFLKAAILSVFIAGAIFAQKAPTVFNLEEKIENSVTVPADVIAILKSDAAVDGCFRAKGEGANENEWFEAAAIDLNGDKRNDLIVKGRDACLFGANQGPFWIFQNRPDGWQKLFSENGLSLTVMPAKTGGFNQMKIARVAAMKANERIFRFSGGKYRAAK